MFQNHKHQIYAIGISTLLSGLSLLCIILFTDPYQASGLLFSFFYLSVFMFSFGLFTLIGLGVRRWLAPKMFVINFYTSLRQGFLVALLAALNLLLMSLNLLFWWVELSLVLLLVCVEFFLNLNA